jgi:hypothetical protein
MRQRAASYPENGDARGRASWRSSLLGDADATLLKLFPHPGLRFALNAPPYGRRRASLRPGYGS